MFKGKQNLRTTALKFSTSANCSLNVYFLRIAALMFIFCESQPLMYESLQVQVKNTELQLSKWSEFCVLG